MPQSNIKNKMILSLGQFLNTKPDATLKGLTRLLATNGAWFPTLKTFWCMLLDKIWYRTIASYKKGKITTDKFIDQMLYQLGIEKNDSNINAFKAAWCAMCDIHVEVTNFTGNLGDLMKIIKPHHPDASFLSSEVLNNLKKQLEDTNTQLVFCTDTNPLQFEHIQKQLRELGYGWLVDDTNLVKHQNSYNANTLDHALLANMAFPNIDMAKGKNIISLHRNITGTKLWPVSIWADNFSFMPQTGSINNAINNGFAEIKKINSESQIQQVTVEQPQTTKKRSCCIVEEMKAEQAIPGPQKPALSPTQ